MAESQGTPKRRTRVQDWYLIVLGNCEVVSEDWDKADEFVSIHSMSERDRKVYRNVADLYDRSLAQCLAPLIAKHQVPAEQHKTVLKRLLKLTGGEHSKEALTAMIKLYDTA